MKLSKILVVVDMLKDFISKNGALFCGPSAEAIIPFVIERIKAYAKAGYLIVFLCDNHDEDDLEFKRFPKHGVKDTDGAKILAEVLNAVAGGTFIIIPKRRYSGFYDTNLDEAIADVDTLDGDKSVEVVGVCTSICIMDTVGGFANRDWSIVVPKAGVADFDPAAHEAALARMKGLYGAEIV